MAVLHGPKENWMEGRIKDRELFGLHRRRTVDCMDGCTEGGRGGGLSGRRED
jgi:hypothetical protein